MCGSGEVQGDLVPPPARVKLQGWVPGSTRMAISNDEANFVMSLKIKKQHLDPILMSLCLSLSLSLFKYIYVQYVYRDFYLYLNRLGVLSVNRKSALEATLFSLELLHSTVIPSFGLVIFVKAWCEYVWITAPCFSPGKALGTPPGHRGRGKHLHGPIDITPLKAARPSRIEIWKRGVVLRWLPCKCYGEHLSSAPNIPNPLRDGLVVEKTHFSIYLHYFRYNHLRFVEPAHPSTLVPGRQGLKHSQGSLRCGEFMTSLWPTLVLLTWQTPIGMSMLWVLESNTC